MNSQKSMLIKKLAKNMLFIVLGIYFVFTFSFFIVSLYTRNVNLDNIEHDIMLKMHINEGEKIPINYINNVLNDSEVEKDYVYFGKIDNMVRYPQSLIDLSECFLSSIIQDNNADYLSEYKNINQIKNYTIASKSSEITISYDVGYYNFWHTYGINGSITKSVLFSFEHGIDDVTLGFMDTNKTEASYIYEVSDRFIFASNNGNEILLQYGSGECNNLLPEDKSISTEEYELFYNNFWSQFSKQKTKIPVDFVWTIENIKKANLK